MKIRKTYIIILTVLLFFSCCVWCECAQNQREVIPNFEEETVPVLNDEMRKLRDDIDKNGDVFSYQSEKFIDDTTVNLPNATHGVVIVSCNAEAGIWLVESDGSVTKISGTTNTAATDSDTDLCVYDGGTYAVVKNRLGAFGEIKIDYRY